MEKKPKLYVLGVAINNYAVPAHQLNGCHNDLNDLVEYLSENINREQWELKICPLKDKAATRAAVIHQFRTFFQPLEDGDTAIFYFSGHGSQALTPEAFQHDTPGAFHETIVCYDSRTTSRDLYDKELSGLIWKATEGKDIHFIVILDCCHSGSGVRGSEEMTAQEENVKKVAARDIDKTWMQDLGADYYHFHAEGVDVRASKHILIAACQRNEKAKECNLASRKRGVLTFALLTALKKSKGNITYGALMEEIQAVVAIYSLNQHPLLEAQGIDQVHQLYFLNAALEREAHKFVVSYHLLKGWVFYRGKINGIVADPLEKHTIKLYTEVLEDGTINEEVHEEIEIDTVYPSYCTLKMPVGFDQKECFLGVLVNYKMDPIKIAIADDSDPKETSLFLKEWNFAPLDFIERSAATEAEYYIELAEKSATIRPVNQHKLSFREVHQGLGRHFFQVLENLEQIAYWHQVKKLDAPASEIPDAALQFTFYEVNQKSSDDLAPAAQTEIPNFLSSTVTLRYQQNPNTAAWEHPAFRLKIENPATNNQCFWISILALETDFRITNRLCPLQMLQPGETHWLNLYNSETNGYSKDIPLLIKEEFKAIGIHELVTHFKILIATDCFNAYTFNQDGIPLLSQAKLEAVGQSRTRGTEIPEIVDWKIFDFSVKVVA